MIKYPKGIFFYLLILVTILSYIIVGTELVVGTFAGDVTKQIKLEFQGEIHSKNIRYIEYPVKISMDVSCKIEETTPGNESLELNFSNIKSNGVSTCFSQIFALNEIGAYRFKETYTMTLSSSILNVKQEFTLEDEPEKRINNSSVSALLEFRLVDMYIDNYEYYVVYPKDTLELFGFDPLIARPGDTIRVTIKVFDYKGGDPVSIAILADWHKVSAITTPSSAQGIIQLKTGWNLISIPVAKCFYEGAYPANQPEYIEPVNIKDIGFNNLAEWFSSALNPYKSWSMVIGEDGAMDSYLDPEFHSLKYISPLEGYWVKIKEGIAGAVLSLDGLLFDTTNPIALTEGWNLVGCPINKGYYDKEPPENIPWIANWEKVDGPVAKHVFKSIENKYSMIIGEDGVYNPDLSEEFNSLHYIVPGSAHWVKISEAADLIYPSGEATGISLFGTHLQNEW